MWASFVTVIVQLMYYSMLCCVVALLACIPLVFLPHQDLHAKIATGHASDALHDQQYALVVLHCIDSALSPSEVITLFGIKLEKRSLNPFPKFSHCPSSLMAQS